jgi:molybdenum cofactor guanylyltransferase
MQITGIILAGGKSSRMGSDKGLLEIGGKTLLEIAIFNLSVLCSRILISTNSRLYDQFGTEIVPDIFPGIGPMGGIYSALKRSSTKKNLVLSVDLPFVNEGLLNHLISGSEKCQVAVPWSGGEYFEPLCACYDLSLLPLMEQFIHSGNNKLPDLFRQCNINPMVINEACDFFHPSLFLNINTKTDLASAQNLMNSIL